jgi:tetratricopeptide (TPR) repeat protein
MNLHTQLHTKPPASNYFKTKAKYVNIFTTNKKGGLTMKKITFIMLIILIPCVIFGAYGEFVKAGNAAYKSGSWLEAARNYKQAYAEKPDETLKKYMNAAVQNAYKEGIAKGNAAYKAGNMEEALKWYAQAQEAAPNKQLENFIAKIRLQAGPDISSMAAPPAKADNDSPWKWVLIGGDAGLTALTVVLILNYNKDADTYNTLYDQINNTDEPSYQRLLSEKAKVEGKQGVVALCGVAAGAAIAYTLLDMLFVHAVFPQDVKAAYNLQEKRFELAVNREF